MNAVKTLPAFSEEERVKAHLFLASRVSTMLGRKFEEADWGDVYCAAKGIPHGSWSNLNIDIMHGSLGVEHKMLRVKSGRSILEVCGTQIMHPSATRSIRIPTNISDATLCAQNVLQQYTDLIRERKRKISEKSRSSQVDLRTGWLLWQGSLKEFLYFEEETIEPNPQDYHAEWKEGGGGSRKKSKTLWVYENSTGKKRYSITTEAGAKIQPYFDVPEKEDKNLYRFEVQGEPTKDGMVRLWLTQTTALFLENALGGLGTEHIERAISNIEQSVYEPKTRIEEATPVLISAATYDLLNKKFKGVSDEHQMQLLIRKFMKDKS